MRRITLFKNFLLFLFVFANTFSAKAQLGGSTSFQFLNLIPSARLTALGGDNVSLYDKDANLTLANPAFLDSTMDGDISLNYINYISDINYGFSSYTQHFKNIGTFSGVFSYADYGKFVRADAIGNQLGDIPAQDLSLIISYGTQLDSVFSVGANVKFFYSSYDINNASGMALDLAGAYFSKKYLLSIGAVVTNLGFKFDDYSETAESKLPLEVKLGVSKKLRYAPIRLSLTFGNLQKWDLTYEDPNAEKQFDPETFEELPPKDPTFLDKAFRHVIVGTEILLSKSFHIQGGFNYRRRAELAINARSGLVGFSTGLGFKVNRFRFNYGLTCYHLASASHNFSISTNLHDFRSK